MTTGNVIFTIDISHTAALPLDIDWFFFNLTINSSFNDVNKKWEMEKEEKKNGKIKSHRKWILLSAFSD